MTIDLNLLTENDIADRLQSLPPAPIRAPYPVNYFNRPRRRAGVLVPFTRIDDAWHLLYIRRTEHEHDHHGGQVAFPGGGEDAQDTSIEDTALREAREEVGLHQQDVRIFGRLEDVISITNYHVTPLVAGFPWPYAFSPDPNEVARIFTIPLSWLAMPENRSTIYRQVDGHSPWPVIYYNEFDGELLWGFTAALTVRLVEILTAA